MLSPDYARRRNPNGITLPRLPVFPIADVPCAVDIWWTWRYISIVDVSFPRLLLCFRWRGGLSISTTAIARLMRRRCFFNSDKIPSTSMLSSSRLEKLDFLSRQGSLFADEGFLFRFQNKSANQTSPGESRSHSGSQGSPSHGLISGPSRRCAPEGLDWAG